MIRYGKKYNQKNIKTMKKSLVIVAAALVFASACQKEQLAPEGNFSIKASREACVDTKASVSDAGAFAWVSGDAIGLYNGSGFNELTTSGSGGTATFTGTVVGTPQTCAIFPYSVAKTVSSVTLPASYVWKENDAPTPMYAAYSASGLEFKHLGGLVKVSVSGIPAESREFVVTADKDICGDYSLVEEGGYKVIKSAGSAANNSVKFTFETPASDMIFYVPVPVGSYKFTVSLNDAGGNELWKFAGSSSNDVTRNRLVRMPLLTIASIPGSGEGSATSVAVPANYSGNFYLPETASDVYVNMSATDNAVTLTYTSGAAVKPANVYVNCGSNVVASLKVDLAESHVELSGNEYTTLSSITSLSTLVINQGTKVNTLNVNAGSVDVQGEVADITISSTVENEATVRISDNGKVTSSITNDSQAEIQKSADNTTVIPAPTGSGNTDVSTVNSDTANDIVKILSEGGSVTLTENLDLYEPVEIFGTTTLALGGFTVSAKHTDEFVFAVHNGATFNITGNGTIDGSNNVLAIKLTVKGDDPSIPAVLKITGAKDASRATVKGRDYAISGNGNRNNTDLTLKYVDCYAYNGTAIYQPQYGKMNVTYSICEGLDSGVEIRSGEASLGYKSDIRSTSSTFTSKPNGNGTTVSGAALVVSQHTTNQAIKVTASGTFTGPCAVFFGDLQDGLAQENTSLNLSGTCNGTVKHENGILTITKGSYNNDFYHSGGSISVSGGTFKANIIISGDPGKFVSGGTYLNEMQTEYLSDDIAVKKITSSGLYNYSKSLSNLSTGTYYLLKDLTNSRVCIGGATSSNNNLVVDLNGHTLTSTATGETFPAFYFHPSSRGNSITFKNGTLKINADSFIGISAKNNNKYILEDGFTMETPVGGVLLEGTASLVMNTGAKIINTGECAAIQTNGLSGNNSNITITGGQISSANGVGIYKPDAGTLTISGGEISGQTAVYVKSGNTTITGGTFNGTGAKADYTYNGNGCIPTGDAFVVDNCGYPGGVPKVSVTGGIFKSSYASAIASYAGNGLSEYVKNFIAKTGVSLTPALESTSELWAE